MGRIEWERSVTENQIEQSLENELYTFDSSRKACGKRCYGGEERNWKCIAVGKFQRGEGKDPSEQKAWCCTDIARNELCQGLRSELCINFMVLSMNLPAHIRLQGENYFDLLSTAWNI